MNPSFSRRQILKVTGAATVLMTASACGQTGANGEASASDSARKVLRVAVANEPPYTQFNPDGSITGAEPDVFKAVAEKLGYDVEGVQVDFDGMIAGLNSGRWDAIAAGMFMNPERCAAVHYTSPILVSTESFAVATGNPTNITTVADIVANPDLTVAAIAGGFHEGFLRAGGVPTSQILTVKDTISGIDALLSDRVDAFCLSTRSLKEFQETRKGYDVTDPIPDAPSSGSGVAFREDDVELWTAYSEAIEEFKASEEFDEILESWGFDPDAARGATVQDLCGT